MSKRYEHPEEIEEGSKTSRIEETEMDEEDTIFAAKLQAWNDQQSIVRDTLCPPPAPTGIISLPVVVKKKKKSSGAREGYEGEGVRILRATT